MDIRTTLARAIMFDICENRPDVMAHIANEALKLATDTQDVVDTQKKYMKQKLMQVSICEARKFLLEHNAAVTLMDLYKEPYASPWSSRGTF